MADSSSGQAIDRAGHVYGGWTVVRRAPNTPWGSAKWWCRCECGTIRAVAACALAAGTSKCCGCRKSKARQACAVEGCEKASAVGRRGWCMAHYLKWRRHGDPTVTILQRQHPPTCAVEGCDLPYSGNGYCRGHRWRWKRYGDPLARGHRRTGKFKNADGYVILYRPEHPNATGKGLIGEHRFVMSEMLGRPLLPGETVHHRNGIRDDNRPANLDLRVGQHGKHADVEHVVEWAREVLRRYGHLSFPLGTP